MTSRQHHPIPAFGLRGQEGVIGSGLPVVQIHGLAENCDPGAERDMELLSVRR